MTVIRFPPSVDTRKGLLSTPSLWRRFVNWLSEPTKAQIFKFKNPTHWRLEKIRRKARGGL
jgi:hypothetical protein